MKDLFEYYQEQPPALKKICDKWQEKQASDGLTYKDCESFQKEVEKIGFTFDSGLDAEPFNLRKIEPQKIENINIGICHRRVQANEPPYFVNYKVNGENKYTFFAMRFSCENFKNRLLKLQ